MSPSSTPSTGLIDNGARLHVDFPFFTGRAGVRLFGDGGEFSCFAEVPFPSGWLTGRVDGRDAVIVQARISATTARMTVAAFRWTGEPA